MSVAARETQAKKKRPKVNDTAISSKGGSAIYVGGGEWYVIAPGLRTGIRYLGRFIEDAQENFDQLERKQFV